MPLSEKVTSQSVITAPWTRPPVVYLSGLLIGSLLDYLFPLAAQASRLSTLGWVPGACLAGAGLAIALLGITNFTRANTPVQSVKPVEKLVTTGIHAWSRNPIYVGLMMMYLGFSLLLESPWALLAIIPIMLVVRFVVIAREERYLQNRFGKEFDDYRKQVRRWF
jgi:protein-S-isoprenylcysteine O-methyltransferase Ste14